MDQGTFYFSQTAMSQPDITNGPLVSFTAAAQQTKKSITNSFISRKPIEFYVKNIFQNRNIMDEYNFYKETNINKIKLFLENFLNELSKPPSLGSRETFGFHPERINTYGSNYKSTESKGVSIEMVNEQLNELKSCLKHFTKSLSEINHAELEYMESIEKTNLSRFTQKYKVNKQVLFQESENLVVFTNNLIQYLEMLNLNINETAKQPENTTAFNVTDLETKEDMKVQHKTTQTVPSPPKQKAEKSIMSKDTSGVTTPKKMSSEMISLAGEESLYSTGIQKTANFPSVSSHDKPMEEPQVSSIQKEEHGQQENFSLNDVQNVQSRALEENMEDKIAQLLQLNKLLGTELEMKDETLRQTKTSFLKEVQDSNNLRVQLTNMIEDNIELKQKFEEAITLNDEFES